MRIVNLAGGLGNQMFQYAFALMLKNHYPDEEVLVDTQHYNTIFFKKFRSVNLHNGYEIGSLFANAPLRIATVGELSRLTYYIPNYVLSRVARRLLPIRKTEYVAAGDMHFTYDQGIFRECDTYYEGYWQYAGYYIDMRKQLQQVFQPPKSNDYNRRMIDRIEGCNSVGIHVRRGDYKDAPEFNGICTTDYYKKAIHHIISGGENPTFFIFSNDMEWCKANMQQLVGPHDIVFVDQNKGSQSCWDMFLMTHCRQLIIANSTFSWWGAFLNDHAETVCAPSPWVRQDGKVEVLDPQWIAIK